MEQEESNQRRSSGSNWETRSCETGSLCSFDLVALFQVDWLHLSVPWRTMSVCTLGSVYRVHSKIWIFHSPDQDTEVLQYKRTDVYYQSDVFHGHSQLSNTGK